MMAADPRFVARDTHRRQSIGGKAPFDDALKSRPEHEISWASLKRRSGRLAQW
jgi:hypothetical protein